MAIKNITSGSGFGGLIPSNNAAVGTDKQGSAGATGYNKKVITRWTQPPASLYRSDQVVGAVAFHSDGIKEVDFILNGGTTVTVTTPEMNPQTGYNEYCVRLSRSDIVGQMNEEFNNVELRAIVRPNVGIPRILQHDIAGISGAEASELMGDVGKHNFYKDNYTAGNSGDGTLIPGEMSFLATMFKENSSSDPSSKKDIEVFISPTGNDTTGNGTRSNPYQSLKTALFKMRDKFKLDPNADTPNGSTNIDQYVDRGVVTLLAGNYNENHIHLNDRLDGDGTDYLIDNLYTWLIIRGDPNEPRENIRLHLDDKEGTTPKGLYMTRQHTALNLLKLQNLVLDISGYWDDNTFRVSLTRGNRDDTNNCISQSKIGNFVLTWLDNVKIQASIFQSTDYSTLFNANTGPFKGPIGTNCSVYGGSALGKSFRGIMRDVDIVKSGEDQSVGCGLILGLESYQAPGPFAKARRIDFYDKDNPSQPHPDYGKFNGWWVTQHGGPDLQAGIGLDSSLSTYLDSTTTNPDRLQFFSFLSGGTEQRDGTKENLGGTWRKINEDAFLNTTGSTEFPKLRLPFLEDIPDDYFDTRENLNSLASFSGSVPVLMDYTKGSINAMTLDERNHYFENKWMATLVNSDVGGGFSAAGSALFDADLPLVYGDGANQQKYLFRQGGTTAAIAGGRNFLGNYANLWTKDSAGLEEHQYGWAEGVTSSILPQHGTANPEDQNTARGGSTSDSHPIESYAISGSVDGTHSDIFQWTVADNRPQLYQHLVDGITTENRTHISNNIFAYNRCTEYTGQVGQLEDYRRKVPIGQSYVYSTVPHALDVAIINNLIGGSVVIQKETGGSGLGWNIASRINNFLFEHNTILNSKLNMGGLETGLTAWTEIDHAGSSFEIPIYNDNWTFRNNIVDGMSGWPFNTWNGAVSWAFTPHSINSLSAFKEANTISEANYIYPDPLAPNGPNPDSPSYPAPGQLKRFVDIDVIQGVTGFVSVEQDRLLNLKFDAYNDPDTGESLPDPVGEYTITPMGVNSFRTPIIAGATHTSVYDDINRVPRQSRATVGAIEAKFSPTDGTIEGNITESISFNLDDIGIVDDENYYGKKFKVKAFLDGEELLSTNSEMFFGYYMQPGIVPADPDADDDDELTYVFDAFGDSSGRETYFAYANGDGDGYTEGDFPPNSDPQPDQNYQAQDNNWLSVENNLMRIHTFGGSYSSGNWKNRIWFIFGEVTDKTNFTANTLGSNMIEIEFTNGVTGEIKSANVITSPSPGFDSNSSAGIGYEIANSSGATFPIPADGINGTLIIKRPV